MVMRLNNNDLELFRWPIDICVFGLAFCYGLTKVLSSSWQGIPSESIKLLVYALATLVSILIVRRYMPSEEKLESHGSLVVSLWINLSLALCAGIPVIGIFYIESPLFWGVMTVSSFMKAIHALEVGRRKNLGEVALPVPKHTKSPFVIWANGVQSPVERFMFEAIPSAYALCPIPTAVILTVAFSSYVGIFLFSNDANYWLYAGTISFCIYTSLSTIGRIRALKLSYKFHYEQNIGIS